MMDELARRTHVALDIGMVLIEPGSGRLTQITDDWDLGELGITVVDLSHLKAQPHPSAVAWLWEHHEGRA